MEKIWTGFKRLGEDIYHLRYALLGIGAYYVTVHLLFGQFCPAMILFHLPCPGCGMTRALLLVLSGQWNAAWKLQPFVFGWMGLAFLFVICRYLLDRKPKLLTGLLIILLVGTLLLYIYRVWAGFPPELHVRRL